LAALLPLDYDRERESAAKKLEVRAQTLDAEVKKAREEARIQAEIALVAIADPALWPEAVNGVALLNELSARYSAYVILPKYAATVLPLWTLHTYCLSAFDASPILLIGSPTRRCGKSRLLDVQRFFVRKAVRTSNITAAALFRYIDAAQPTLLIDEVDSFAHLHEELRNVLNSGYERSGVVIRCVGDDLEPHAFSTYCAKTLAMIDKSKLSDTILDRSIILDLQRKRKDQEVDRLRQYDKETVGELGTLAQQCLRWAVDHVDELRKADVDVPDELNDRAQDSWRPLLAIADAVGGDWPEKAREAALALSARADLDEEDIAVQLLADIRLVFKDTAKDYQIPTKVLLAELCEDEAKPWATYNKGQAIGDRQLSKLLKRFKIESTQLTLPDQRRQSKRGYVHRQFLAAFKRYLPSPELDGSPK
jgi:putative DNA primase/helicase